MSRRWVKNSIRILLILAVLPFIFLGFEHVRGRLALSHYKRKLAAAGEKISPQSLTVHSSDGENGAPEVLEAFKKLKGGVILPKNYPPRMKLTPAGRAIVCFRENEWVDDGVTNHWEQLAEDIKANAETLQRIREALKKPILMNDLDFSQGFKMSFTHLFPGKALTYWFGSKIQLMLHQGQTHSALEDLLAETRLPQLMANDRIAISGLVSMAIAAIAKVDTWEALQADGWADPDLATVQAAWEKLTFATNMLEALEGEIVFADVSFDIVRKSNHEAITVIFGMEEFLGVVEPERPLWSRILRRLAGGDAAADFLRKKLYCRIWRFAWLDQEELHYLRQTHRLLEIARTATIEKSLAAIKAAKAQFEQTSLSKGFYDRLRYPTMFEGTTLSTFVDKAMRAETERSMVICAIALKRHFVRHGAWPTSLNALVPEFLSAVPVDYMDGHPMRYHLGPNGAFTLYSVGEDLIDDHGDSNFMTAKKSSKNLWDRKDFIWPLPAEAAEVEAYRKQTTEK